MNDARFDRSCAGDAAGHVVPAEGPGQQPGPEHAVAAARDWTRRSRRPGTDTSLLVHWIDDKGSVVRLITSSSDGDPVDRGA